MENMSLADIAAVMDNKENDGILSGGNWFFAVIVLFFVLFMFRGFGGYDNGGATLQGQYATQADIQRGFDNNGVTNKLNALENGLCQLGYSTQGGFNTISQNICNLGYQMQSCCCETNRNIDAVRYENAKNTCDIITANNNNTQRIIDMYQANQIQTLRDANQALTNQLSNLSQTASIVNQLKPSPIPAYLTCSPYQAQQFAYNNMNCGSCGC